MGLGKEKQLENRLEHNVKASELLLEYLEQQERLVAQQLKEIDSIQQAYWRFDLRKYFRACGLGFLLSYVITGEIVLWFGWLLFMLASIFCSHFDLFTKKQSNE